MPFEEDDKDPSIWFLDHSYLENMFRMFKKVNGERGRVHPLRPSNCLSQLVSPTVERACMHKPGSHPRNFQHPTTPLFPPFVTARVAQRGSASSAGTTLGRGCAKPTSTSTSSSPATVTIRCLSSARCR